MTMTDLLGDDLEVWLDAHPADEDIDNASFDEAVPAPLISGVTTNPSIVSDYIQRNPVHQRFHTTEERIADVVCDAASRLHRLYKRSHRRKGWVSAQISPEFINSTEKIVEQGLRFSQLAPNIMVKVPCNDHGIVAIGELVSRGVSINGTMTFYASQVKEFAEAVARGRQNLLRSTPEPRTVVTHMIGRVGDGIHSEVRKAMPLNHLREFECMIGRTEQNIISAIEPATTLLLSSVRSDSQHNMPAHIGAFLHTKAVLTLKPETLEILNSPLLPYDRAARGRIDAVVDGRESPEDTLDSIPADILDRHLQPELLAPSEFGTTPEFLLVQAEITTNASRHHHWNRLKRSPKGLPVGA